MAEEINVNLGSLISGGSGSGGSSGMGEFTRELKNATKELRNFTRSITGNQSGSLGLSSGGDGGGAGAGAGMAAGAGAGGLRKFLGKGSVIGIALFGILAVSKKLLGKMTDASASLQATSGIMGQAMKLFFKPFGDFLSMLLRPMAVALLRFAIKFNKDFSADKLKEIFNIDKLGEALGTKFGSFSKLAEGDFWGFLKDFVKGEIDLNVWFMEMFWKALKKAFTNQIDIWRWMWKLTENFVTGSVDIAGDIWGWLKERFEGGVEILDDVWGWLRTRFIGKIHMIEHFWKWLKKQFIGKIEIVKHFWEWFKKKKFGEGKISISKDVWGFISSRFRGTLDLGSKIWNWVKKNLLEGNGGGGGKDKDEGDFLSGVGKGMKSTIPFFGADGGIVNRRQKVTVGERGPEAIIPLSRLDKGFGSGFRVDTININSAMFTDESSVDTVVNQVVEKIEEQMMEKIRRRTSYGF